MNQPQLKHYLPALILFFFALFFAAFPAFTAFLVTAGLMSVAVIYALIIYRIHRIQKYSENYQPMYEFEKDLYDIKEPNFRNITVTVIKKRFGPPNE